MTIDLGDVGLRVLGDVDQQFTNSPKNGRSRRLFEWWQVAVLVDAHGQPVDALHFLTQPLQRGKQAERLQSGRDQLHHQRARDLTIRELDLDYFFPMITSLTFMIISSPPA